ncbi:uncharacterized protein LOC132168163 [Corylus avellana]|uniref:uncharacterized protein LOC132168163 n=1 Tax=Corylus avellana TaxID=13451 RepID=UPI00286A8BF4|nr:uncharacterized protein LOC132168163 [Corylus avellana]
MDFSSQNIDSLITQTAALTWEDPSSQLETLPSELVNDELLPLVGQVISQKTQNNQSVNAALTKAWFFAIPFSFAVLGPNTYLFKFSEKDHISRIRNQVWNVNGFLLALQTWSPTATLGELSLKEVPFWIQVHGLPLHNLSIKNAIAIGKGLGHLVKVEDASGVDTPFRSYLRLLVDVDISKPLNPGFLFTRNDGTSTWISLKYERLDVYCTECGKIGHKHFSCLSPQAARVPSRPTNILSYDPAQTAQLKPISSEYLNTIHSPDPAKTSQHKPISPDNLNTTASINIPFSSSVPTKSSHTSTQYSRKSPYNIRPPKKPTLPSLENSHTPPHSPPSSPLSSPTHQINKKRTRLSDLAFPSKKRPGASTTNVEHPNQPHSQSPVFTPGSSEKLPARSIFRAARKGKNKLVSVVVAAEVDSVKKGGFVKPPQHQ